MAAAKKWISAEGLAVSPIVPGECVGIICRRCPVLRKIQPPAFKWTRCAVLLLVAVISALQHPVQALEDSSSQSLGTSMPMTESPTWPSEEVMSSSTANGLLETKGQLKDNTTLYSVLAKLFNTSISSEISQSVIGQENVTMFLEESNSSVESSTFLSVEETISTSGLIDTSVFLTFVPSSSSIAQKELSLQPTSSYSSNVYIESTTIPNILKDFLLSSTPEVLPSSSSISTLPSPSSMITLLASLSLPSSTPPSAKASSEPSMSVDNVHYDMESSTNVPYSDRLTHVTTLGNSMGSTFKKNTNNIADPNLNVTSTPFILETTSNLETSEADTTLMREGNTRIETMPENLLTGTKIALLSNGSDLSSTLPVTINSVILHTSSVSTPTSLDDTTLPARISTMQTLSPITSDDFMTKTKDAATGFHSTTTSSYNQFFSVDADLETISAIPLNTTLKKPLDLLSTSNSENNLPDSSALSSTSTWSPKELLSEVSNAPEHVKLSTLHTSYIGNQASTPQFIVQMTEVPTITSSISSAEHDTRPDSVVFNVTTYGASTSSMKINQPSEAIIKALTSPIDESQLYVSSKAEYSSAVNKYVSTRTLRASEESKTLTHLSVENTMPNVNKPITSHADAEASTRELIITTEAKTAVQTTSSSTASTQIKTETSNISTDNSVVSDNTLSPLVDTSSILSTTIVNEDRPLGSTHMKPLGVSAFLTTTARPSTSQFHTDTHLNTIQTKTDFEATVSNVATTTQLSSLSNGEITDRTPVSEFISATQDKSNVTVSSLASEETTFQFESKTDSNTINSTEGLGTTLFVQNNGNPLDNTTTVVTSIHKGMLSSHVTSPAIQENPTMTFSSESSDTTVMYGTVQSGISVSNDISSVMPDSTKYLESLQTGYQSTSNDVSSQNYATNRSITILSDMSSHLYVSTETTTQQFTESTPKTNTAYVSTTLFLTTDFKITDADHELSSSSSLSTDNFVPSALPSETGTEISDNHSSPGNTKTPSTDLTSLVSLPTSDQPQTSQTNSATEYNLPSMLTTLSFSANSEITSVVPSIIPNMTTTENYQSANLTSVGYTVKPPTGLTALSSEPTTDQPQTSKNTYSPSELYVSSVFQTIPDLSFSANSEISSAEPTVTKLTTLINLATEVQTTSSAKEHSNTSTGSGSPLHTALSTINPSETLHANGTPTFYSTAHFPPDTQTPMYSSSTPHTTAIIPTNMSDSFFTESSSLSTREFPKPSATQFTTQPLNSTVMLTFPLNETLTVPTTSQVLPLTSSTIQSTLHTKTTIQSILNKTSIRPASTYTQMSPSPLLTTAVTPSIPITHSSSTLRTASATMNVTRPVTDPVTSTPVSTPSPTSTKTESSVMPVTNATAVHSTAPTTFTIPTTTPSPLECTLSSDTMLKTVITLSEQLIEAEKENAVRNLTEAINQTLYQALKQPIQVLVNRTSLNMGSQQSNNVTMGYSISVNYSVYIPSAIVDVLVANDVIFVANLKHRIPSLQSVPVLAVPWDPVPGYAYQLKTVLKLMGTGGNIHSCSYIRSMEQKLEVAFEKADITVNAGRNNLTVQILNTSQVEQVLTMVYVVRNDGVLLQGTESSKILNILLGEVVGYYLGDPPLIIAEPLFYPSIDTSEKTRDSWVITVILGVDDTLLGINNQSFARLMEERLATLFQISGQRSRRFRRETTIGSYTVQMVGMQRVGGSNNPAELTYYALKNRVPILGTAAAKQLNTIDPQTMALTLGYIVRLQADPVVKKPPNNLWIIAAVLAPIAVVTVIIIIITAVLCRKNKSDFKSENMTNIPPRTKPVQGFDYAKQHLGQQGGDEDVLPVTQETVLPSLNLSQERDSTQDGSTEKMLKPSDTRKGRSPCENGSVISNESEEASSDRSTLQKVMAQHRVTKDEACKRNGFTKTRKIVPITNEEEASTLYEKNTKMPTDPFDSSSGSVQLIGIKPVPLPPSYPAPDRNQDLAALNGEVNKALKQKSDIEHYRNKLRLKAKRKGYYDFPPVDSRSLTDRKRKTYDKAQMEINNVLDADTDTSSPFAEPRHRQSSMKNHPYRSRQSLNSPSPGETEMDLLVTRERPRRGIRNSGYDTEPEMIEETNIDRVKQARTFIKSRQVKGHSETSTLSSQPSIDEVRQQMHMLLEEAFSLASAGHREPKRQQDPYASVQHMPYSDVVTSAPGTISRPRMQWVPTYGPEVYQYSLPRPTYRFSQLPEMVMGSPPPPVPPRTGPVAVPSLRRSTSDMASKTRIPEPGGNEQGQGNSVPAVFAIPGNRAGYSGYFIPQPPTTYRNQAWMSSSGDNELPGQWADSVPLPGYIEAYPRSRYQQNSPSRLPRQYSQPVNMHSNLDHAVGPSIGASQQSLADNDTPDTSITNLSTAALVKAIREEVAKLAKKQTDLFEFQV